MHRAGATGVERARASLPARHDASSRAASSSSVSLLSRCRSAHFEGGKSSNRFGSPPPNVAWITASAWCPSTPSWTNLRSDGESVVSSSGPHAPACDGRSSSITSTDGTSARVRSSTSSSSHCDPVAVTMTSSDAGKAARASPTAWTASSVKNVAGSSRMGTITCRLTSRSRRRRTSASLTSARSQLESTSARTPSTRSRSDTGVTFVRDLGKSTNAAAIRPAPTRATAARKIQPESGGFTQSAEISTITTTYAVTGVAASARRARVVSFRLRMSSLPVRVLQTAQGSPLPLPRLCQQPARFCRRGSEQTREPARRRLPRSPSCSCADSMRRLSRGLRARRALGLDELLQAPLDQLLPADRDDELADAGDERECRDQGEHCERAGARPREDHDSEHDRDEAVEDRERGVVAVQRKLERRDDGDQPEHDCVRADHVQQRERGDARPRKNDDSDGGSEEPRKDERAALLLVLRAERRRDLRDPDGERVGAEDDREREDADAGPREHDHAEDHRRETVKPERPTPLLDLRSHELRGIGQGIHLLPPLFVGVTEAMIDRVAAIGLPRRAFRVPSSVVPSRQGSTGAMPQRRGIARGGAPS